MIDLSRYIFEALRKDEEFILYRGQSKDDASQVLGLSPAVQRSAPETLKRLEHEYSLREELDPTWAARPLQLLATGTDVLVLGPRRCASRSIARPPLDLAFSLRLAIGLSTAIDHLHQRGIIHKDIKPANVLVNSVTGQCWLMGFGIASRLPRERQSPEPPEFVAGTLAYMAPEQTGRMNRSIDSRSDLYFPGRDALRNADWKSSLHRFRSHGMGSLPHCKAANTARRAVEECPGLCLCHHHEAAREDC